MTKLHSMLTHEPEVLFNIAARQSAECVLARVAGESRSMKLPDEKHELFEQLDACNPRWQSCYRTLADAALAYDLVTLYVAYIATPEGQAHLARMRGVPDTLAEVERIQAELEKARHYSILHYKGQTYGDDDEY